MNKIQEFKFNWPILGHQNITKYLQNLIISKQFVGSYLFFGPEDVGKKTMAKLFIKSIFCLENQNSKEFPCDKCSDCKAIDKNIHSSYTEINLGADKKNISIEQIRKIKEKLYLTSANGSYKVVIINQAGALSKEASNALLKIIEEPPQNSLIILIAEKVDQILPTIKSRTQNIVFNNISLKEIYEYLLSLGANKDLAQELAEFSGGLPGLALFFYKNPKLWKQRKETLNNLLELFDLSLSKRFNWVNVQIKIAKKNSNQYDYFEFLLNSYLRIVRDLSIFKLNPNLNLLYPFLKEKIQSVSKKYEINKLLKFYQDILSSKKMLNQNVSPRLILENLLLI